MTTRTSTSGFCGRLLRAGLLLWPAMAGAVSGGVPDVLGEHDYVLALIVDFGKKQYGSCSASLLDDRTLIAAAHCVVDEKTGRLATDAVVRERMNGWGQVPVTRAYVHPEYLKTARAGKRSYETGPYDIAILKTGAPVSQYLPIGGFGVIPMTRHGRYTKAGDGGSVLDVRGLRGGYRRDAVLAEVRRASEEQRWGNTEAFIVGFGFTRCVGKQENCSQQADIRQAIGLRYGVFDDNELCTEASSDEVLLAPQSCSLLGGRANVLTPTDRKGANQGQQHEIGTRFQAAPGDSGGPVAVALRRGRPTGGGGEYLIFALTRWGSTHLGVGFSTGLMAQEDFIFAALEGDTACARVVSHELAGKLPLRKSGQARDGFYAIDAVDGRAVSYVGTGLLLSDHALILQLGCDKRWHFVSTKETVLRIGTEPDYRYQVCARNEDDGDRALRGLYQLLQAKGTLTVETGRLVLRDTAGRERASFKKE